MPKEFIRDEYENAIGLRIGWSREQGHVQVATIAIDNMVLEPTPEGNGWFVTLDRQGINDAIRTLRKARDQAYGADA